MIRKAVAALALFTAASTGAQAQNGIEGPSFEVIRTEGSMQLRAYDPMIVAEVTVQASNIREAASRGFRPLANYIFGDNEVRQDIAMTAPVISQPASAKIAMTAPVISEPNDSGDFVVKFVMPAKWTMETLPTPRDNRVRLVDVPCDTRAVLRYVGKDGAGLRAEAETQLTQWVSAQGYAVTGPMMWAGYSGPSVPRSQRVFEIMLPVEKAPAS